ncbi:MAG TPA: NfeD family protein [Nocardioidaceae bacterium]|nr:NfeD family protein [Actinomycetota bacterium]HEV8055202.1 NfeD family protein [Nocardioidaceae bacterium]
MEWLSENGWAAWAGLAVLLAIAELLSLDLVLLMLAVGALGGGVTSALGGPLALQIVVAVAVAMGTLMFVRPSVVKRMHSGPELTTGHANLVGKQGLVVAEITAYGGQVRLGGELWTARPFDESVVIPAGATVDVFEIDGATAVVYPVDQVER